MYYLKHTPWAGERAGRGADAAAGRRGRGPPPCAVRDAGDSLVTCDPHRKVDARLLAKGNSTCHVARPAFSIHFDDQMFSDQ